MGSRSMCRRASEPFLRRLLLNEAVAEESARPSGDYVGGVGFGDGDENCLFGAGGDLRIRLAE